MTVTLTLRLPETEARRLADAIGDHESFWDRGNDLLEIEQGVWDLTIYFEQRPEEPLRDSLDALGRSVLGRQVRFAEAELPDTDWVAKSLADLAPVRAGRFIVHGSHDRDKPLANEVAIEIEAGEAFGTGHHGTTAGCLAAIDQAFRHRSFGAALDLGTGSGVLAIAITKAWRVPVVATDIDPVAARIARHNARLNGVGHLVDVGAGPGFRLPVFAGRPQFGLIVANILAGPLIRMARDLVAHLRPGGTVILSGLLAEQAPRVLAAYRNQGLALERRALRDGWATLTLRSRQSSKDRRCSRASKTAPIRLPGEPGSRRCARRWRRSG